MICTVTFNPSLDYIVRVDDMRLGAINRTAYEQVLPGGKGVNVSIVLGNLGHKSRALGFVSGFTGDELCRLCAEAGVEISAVPGPSAAVTALALSALPSGRFTFEGFLSTSGRSRREHLESLKGERRTMIFYEAPHKLRRTLADLRDGFGAERRAALCREMTKLHEEVIRTTLGEAAELYTEENPPRGEFAIVIAGAPEDAAGAVTPEAALALVNEYRAGGMSLKEACRHAAEKTGLKKNELYDLAVNTPI